jgi:hypothetical protein
MGGMVRGMEMMKGRGVCSESGESHFDEGGGFTITRVVVIKELFEFTEPSSSEPRDSL